MNGQSIQFLIQIITLQIVVLGFAMSAAAYLLQ